MIPLIGLLAIDVLALGAVWLASYGAIGIWFSRAGGQDKLAAAILASIFAWRFIAATSSARSVAPTPGPATGLRNPVSRSRGASRKKHRQK